MSAPVIDVSCDDDGVVLIHMRDTESRNALGPAFVERLTEVLAAVSRDRQAKVCVVRGLPDVFCAGGSEKMLIELCSGRVAATDIMLTRAMLEVPIPTIAAIEGHAVGGGLILGLSCDLVVLARESRYGCSFINMGFTPGMGTTRLLQLSFGEYVAAEMMFGGQYFRGTHFEGRSGINYIVPRAEVYERATELAARIAEKPRHALDLLKRSLSLTRRQAFETARTMESMMHEICFAKPDTKQQIEQNYAGPLRLTRSPGEGEQDA